MQSLMHFSYNTVSQSSMLYRADADCDTFLHVRLAGFFLLAVRK